MIPVVAFSFGALKCKERRGLIVCFVLWYSPQPRLMFMRISMSRMLKSLRETGDTFACTLNTLYLIPHVVSKVCDYLIQCILWGTMTGKTVHG